MAPTRRHARHGRAPMVFRGRVPAARTRGQEFARRAAVLFAEIRTRADGELDDVDLLIDDVPARDAGLALGGIRTAAPGRPAAVVVHRLPVISRSASDDDLEDLLTAVLADQSGLLTGRDPDQLRG